MVRREPMLRRGTRESDGPSLQKSKQGEQGCTQNTGKEPRRKKKCGREKRRGTRRG